MSSEVDDLQTAEPADQEIDLAAELEALREEVVALRESKDTYRRTVIKPRFDALGERLDESRQERRVLEDELGDLRSEVHDLQAKVESLLGVSEEAATSPEKRRQDLQQALIRRAEARTGDGARKTSMYWEEIQDLFADLGHGEVKKPECYQALDEVAECDGFHLGTKTSRNGNEVKAVLVDLDDLESGSRNSTTRHPGAGSAQRPRDRETDTHDA